MNETGILVSLAFRRIFFDLVVGISFLRKGKSDHLTKHFATFQQIAALLQMSEFSQRSQIASFSRRGTHPRLARIPAQDVFKQASRVLVIANYLNFSSWSLDANDSREFRWAGDSNASGLLSIPFIVIGQLFRLAKPYLADSNRGLPCERLAVKAFVAPPITKTPYLRSIRFSLEQDSKDVGGLAAFLALRVCGEPPVGCSPQGNNTRLLPLC